MTGHVTGFQCRVKKLGDHDFVGFIVAIDEGRFVWSQRAPVRRLSRGDALQDAHALAHEAIVARFNSCPSCHAAEDTPHTDTCSRWEAGRKACAEMAGTF